MSSSFFSQAKSQAKLFGKEINQYWFGYGSAASLGIFRILASSVILLNLCFLLCDFDTWYSEKGLIPLKLLNLFNPPLDPHFQIYNFHFTLPFTPPRLSLLANVTDRNLTLAFFIVTLVCAILTLLGLWTKVSSILLAIGVVSLNHRTMPDLHGGDTVMRISALYMAIAPVGRCCSLDRLIGLWRGTQPKIAELVSLWPQRLIQYNLALIYFTTWWLKMDGSRWRNGTAVWYSERLNEFYHFPQPEFMHSLPVAYFLTYFTLGVEVSMATLVFYRPLRNYVLVLGVIMHFGIEYTMNIPLFSMAMISMYVTFFKGEEIGEFARFLGSKLSWLRIELLVPFGKQLRPHPAIAFQAADPLRLVQFNLSSDDTVEESHWRAKSSRGESWIYLSGLRFIGAFPFTLVPGFFQKVLNLAAEEGDSAHGQINKESGYLRTNMPTIAHSKKGLKTPVAK